MSTKRTDVVVMPSLPDTGSPWLSVWQRCRAGTRQTAELRSAEIYISTGEAHLGTGGPERGEAHGVGEKDTRDSHHGPARVGELRLLVPREVVGVGAEAQRVKAVVSGCATTAGCKLDIRKSSGSKPQSPGA